MVPGRAGIHGKFPIPQQQQQQQQQQHTHTHTRNISQAKSLSLSKFELDNWETQWCLANFLRNRWPILQSAQDVDNYLQGVTEPSYQRGVCG